MIYLNTDLNDSGRNKANFKGLMIANIETVPRYWIGMGLKVFGH